MLPFANAVGGGVQQPAAAVVGGTVQQTVAPEVGGGLQQPAAAAVGGAVQYPAIFDHLQVGPPFRYRFGWILSVVKNLLHVFCLITLFNANRLSFSDIFDSLGIS